MSLPNRWYFLASHWTIASLTSPKICCPFTKRSCAERESETWTALRNLSLKASPSRLSDVKYELFRALERFKRLNEGLDLLPCPFARLDCSADRTKRRSYLSQRLLDVSLGLLRKVLHSLFNIVERGRRISGAGVEVWVIRLRKEALEDTDEDF